MNDFFSSYLFKVLSAFAILISIAVLLGSAILLIKRKANSKNKKLNNHPDKKITDVESYQDKLLTKEKEISDLHIKLDLKKSFEGDLIKAIYEVESKDNFDSKQLLNEIKIKLQNLNEIDKKQLSKNAIVLEDKELFQKELERLHPELSYQERLLCTYFRLNLSSKEISVIEGITNGTVRVYKNKIKNKIGLSTDESLIDYLCNISIKKN
jgi:DNA-binding CsgD family transcriptional regulator